MDRAWQKDPQLVIGIDIGTTCSAVSFIYLTKDARPEIQRVTKWPGQSDNQGQCRLPSWIWYSFEDKPVKVGAEALNQDADEAKEQGYQLAKNFKLHLHPTDMAPTSSFHLDPLPTGVSVQQVYTDYLRYLFAHTKTFFCEHVFRGQEIWQSLASSMSIVMAHPNGWGTREQGVLRRAVLGAGLTTTTNFEKQISFVSEAEASVQFCLNSSSTVTSLMPCMNIIVCDAGGSTVDTTAYNVVAVDPLLELKEVKGSACIQAGGMFVDSAAESYLRTQLRSADLDEDDIDTYVQDGLTHFAEFPKLNFNGAEQSIDVKIGNRRLNVSAINVHGGRMKIPGPMVKAFFDTCTERIRGSVSSQSLGLSSPYFFLVGGFGDSPYLKTEIQRHIGVTGRLTTSNVPGAKAVADGAAIWAVTRSVISRATRYSYGIEISLPYNPQNGQHSRRPLSVWPSGIQHVRGGWSQIVAKDQVLDCDSAVKLPYSREYGTQGEASSTMTETVWATLLPSTHQFMRNEFGWVYDGWTSVCEVSAHFDDIKALLVQRHNPSGGVYWILEYKVGIRFGGTQLSAYVEWVQNGQTMTGPATIIPATFI